MLTAPNLEEDLFMYLSVSDHAVSAMLLRDQGVQHPLYYISKTLVDAETRYVLAPGKFGVDISSCHKKATPLLSGSYRIHIIRISFAVIVKEI